MAEAATLEAPVTDSIGFLMNDTARLFRRSFDARAKDSGVTALQWRMIAYLKRSGPIRQGPLAELIEVEAITLSRMTDRLEEAGLVERHIDPTDRRAWLLHLTPLAERKIEEMRDVTDALTEEATNGLSHSERTQLASLVERVRANLSRRDVKAGD